MWPTWRAGPTSRGSWPGGGNLPVHAVEGDHPRGRPGQGAAPVRHLAGRTGGGGGRRPEFPAEAPAPRRAPALRPPSGPYCPPWAGIGQWAVDVSNDFIHSPTEETDRFYRRVLEAGELDREKFQKCRRPAEPAPPRRTGRRPSSGPGPRTAGKTGGGRTCPRAPAACWRPRGSPESCRPCPSGPGWPFSTAAPSTPGGTTSTR